MDYSGPKSNGAYPYKKKRGHTESHREKGHM